MRNTFKYTALYLMRDRNILLWALAFPIILSTLFFLMFGGIDSAPFTHDQEIVVVEDAAWQADEATVVREVVSAASEPGSAPDGEGAFLAPTYVPDEAAAKQALGDTGAIAYIKVDAEGAAEFFMKRDPSDTSITTRQTIVKTVIDGAQRTESAISDAVEQRVREDLTNAAVNVGVGAEGAATVGSAGALVSAFEGSASDVAESVSRETFAEVPAGLAAFAAPDAAPAAAAISALVERALDAADADFTKQVSLTANAPAENTRYYYALLGMAALFAAYIGVIAMNRLGANTSDVGARRTLGSTSRGRATVATFAASWVLSFMCLLVAYAYIRCVLGVDFGGRDAFCVLALAAAALMATSLGVCVGAIPGIPEAGKNGIITGIACFSSLFAGLYGQACMYLADDIAAAAPWTQTVNPARVISQAFYSLYYYDSYEPFAQTLGALAVMTAVFLAGAALLARRQQHEHL